MRKAYVCICVCIIANARDGIRKVTAGMDLTLLVLRFVCVYVYIDIVAENDEKHTRDARAFVTKFKQQLCAEFGALAFLAFVSIFKLKFCLYLFCIYD